MMKKLTLKEFIERARGKHGDKYDYSEAEYTNIDSEVTIICPIHGKFKQIAYDHLKGCGCSKCAAKEIGEKRRISKEEWLKRFKKAHGDKYIYDEAEFKRKQDEIKIICPEHGEFWQSPESHAAGHGCKICAGHEVYDTETFIAKAKKMYGDKYTYDNVKYVNTSAPILITCPKHGDFSVTPNNFLKGHGGCKKCTNRVTDTDSFIRKAILLHGDKYNYDNVKYVSIWEPVCIVCPEHGEFWQVPNLHTNNFSPCGCPDCNKSKLEIEMDLFFKKEGIEFIPQHKFAWSGRQTVDFYLPKYNIAIECQGIQHYTPRKLFGGEDAFRYTKDCDLRKKQLCMENGVKLLYFTKSQYMKHVSKEDVDLTYTNKDKLLAEIKQHEKSI